MSLPVTPSPDPRGPLSWPENLLLRRSPQPNGCVLFTGMVEKNGYGRLTIGGRKLLAHRAAYEMAHGPIPDGMVIDHVCHNRDRGCPGGVQCLHRRCVNPEHMEVVTHDENKRRGQAGQIHALRCAEKTHCPQGHLYDEKNTYRHPEHGWRSCRTCKKERSRALRSRTRAAA